MPKAPDLTAPKPAAAKKVVKKTSVKKTEPKTNGRPVIYDDISVRVLRGDDALTEGQAKQLAGWHEVGTEDDFLFTDMEGKRIQLSNNKGNRPFTLANALAVCQTHLKKGWKLNGETLIIGATGLTISAQHRLVGLIFACQKYREDPSKYLLLDAPPTMETLIAFGIDESDDVVNTVDTGKSRSIADIIFRSEYFSDFTKQARKECSRITEHAIRFIWDRVGISAAFSVIKTPAESIDFLSRHPRLLECVRHVYEENGKENRLGTYLTPGYCSGLFFLMACSTSDATKYRSAMQPNQETLDWSNFERAETFITLLGSGSKDFAALRQAIGAIIQASVAGGTREERTALLVKAWNRYADGKSITEPSLRLEYDTNEDGVKILIERPTVGGIDIEDADAQNAKDAVAEEVEQDPETGTPAGETERLKGSKVWVKEKSGGHWWGFLDHVYTEGRTKLKIAKVKVPKGFAGAGTVLIVNYSSIQDDEPK